MPHSRHRHKHQSHQPHHRPVAAKTKRKATPIATFLIAVFGLVMGALASQSSFLWMAVGALAGAVAGYLVGRNIDRGAAKN
ncbi:MAG TPA: hypothetical protein VH396_02555 [Chitinophagaceae bacterium]|jgi:fatty acid desaturase